MAAQAPAAVLALAEGGQEAATLRAVVRGWTEAPKVAALQLAAAGAWAEVEPPVAETWAEVEPPVAETWAEVDPPVAETWAEVDPRAAGA